MQEVPYLGKGEVIKFGHQSYTTCKNLLTCNESRTWSSMPSLFLLIDNQSPCPVRRQAFCACAVQQCQPHKISTMFRFYCHYCIYFQLKLKVSFEYYLSVQNNNLLSCRLMTKYFFLNLILQLIQHYKISCKLLCKHQCLRFFYCAVQHCVQSFQFIMFNQR